PWTVRTAFSSVPPMSNESMQYATRMARVSAPGTDAAQPVALTTGRSPRLGLSLVPQSIQLDPRWNCAAVTHSLIDPSEQWRTDHTEVVRKAEDPRLQVDRSP